MTVDVERELRSALRREVDRVEVPPAPELEPRPAPPRWRRWLGAPHAPAMAIAAVAAVAVAVTAFAVPMLLEGNDLTLPPAQTYDSSRSPGQWPARGSLAGDKGLQAKARSWFAANVSNTVKLKPADFHVVYASDIEDYRIVVATFVRTYDGPDRERSREFVMLHAQAGSSDLRQAAEFGPGPQLAQSTDSLSYRSMAVVELWESREVVVVAPPGTERVDYSPTARLRADGTITRAWTAVRDARVEDGIFRFTAPDEDARPRIRTVADGQVIADSGLQAYVAVDDTEVSRLKMLIQAGSGGKAVGRLATELKEFEYTIGRVIERVEVVRTFGPDDDYWVQAVAYTFDGGAIEVFFSDDPKKQDRADGQYGLGGGAPAPLVARLVPAAQAGEETAVWLNIEQCRVLGWDPNGRTAAVELVVNGKSAGRKPSESRPIGADFCDKPRDESAILPEIEVRLYDQAGKQIWSERPAYNPNGGFMNEHDNLDVPTTIGDRVG